MIKRWLCLFLVYAFMLQSVAAGAELLDMGRPSTDHEALTLDAGHTPDDADHATQDCDVHQHGHCCHGHFSAVLGSHTVNFSAASVQFSSDYTFFIPSSPASELLRPPTV
jgi:hypothetical protein